MQIDAGIKKLIGAIQYGCHIKLTLSRTQFVGNNGVFVTMYTISEAEYDETTNKYHNVEIYRTASKLRTMMYLLDYFNTHTGKELAKNVPPMWLPIREKLIREGNKAYG